MSKPTSDDIRGVWVAASMGASTYSHATTPNTKTPDNIHSGDTAAANRMKCVEITPGTPEEGDTFTAARSNHVGGVNVIFADGSAKFYTDRVDRKGWTALAATRAGGDASSTSDIDGMSGIPMVAEHPWFARTASSSRWVYELPAFDCPVGATHST